MLHINRAILSISFIKLGRLTADYTVETHAAAVACCRLRLPEITEPRQEHVESIHCGKPVLL